MKKVSVAGTTDSNDCQITIKDYQGLLIEVESIVKEFFGDHIENLIKGKLEELKIDNVHVSVIDKGAYDFTIISRLVTALTRAELI